LVNIGQILHLSIIQKYYFGLEDIGIERAFSSFYFLL
jgi:hypothetical protein